MTVTTTWEINTMKRDISDGYVTDVIWRCIGKSDDVEKARETGSVALEMKPESLPSDFKSFNDLTSTIVLGWVKDTLGSTEVTKIENYVTEAVNEVITPTVTIGIPW